MGLSDGKRVWCLYRVSTKYQVEENDIPMQRKECQAFCRKKEWELTRELQEQGVSGYSISLDEREVIREIKIGAINKEYDIFLVYMFDRVGRKEFEVPAFLRFLVENGIQVWSTQEGEQRFDNDADSFLAMIRSFTAQRESAKLATRIHTKQKQMALAGQYRGGALPYGYKTRESTSVNRKGNRVREIVKNEAEAAVVRMIFDMRVNEKLGTHAIAKKLCEMNIPGDKHRWRSSTVTSLLSRRIYIGQMTYGDECSMPFEHLRIISNDVFEKAQQMRRQPPQKVQRTERPVIQYYDVLFCDHCDGHLLFDVSHKVIPDCEKVYSREIFRCYNKFKYASPCDGQSVYSKKRIDKAVIGKLRETLTILMNADPEQLINAATERMYCEKKQRIEEMEENLIKLQSEINMMQRELVYATDVYGIEATTNLQILITEQLNNLSIAKDRLNAEKGSFRSRKAISQRMEKELLKAKDVFLNFDNMPEDDLLKYSTTVYEQIRFGRNYKVSTVLSPLLKMFMTADTVQ